MGLRGPLPVPPKLRVLRGMRKTAPPELPGVHAPVEAPAMPDWLGPDAKKEWRRVVPLLHDLGLISKLDMASVSLYCSAWGTFVVAERALQAEVQRLTDAGGQAADALIEISERSGLGRTSALQRMAAASRAEAERHLAQLGLTPAARCRLRPSRAAEPDEVSDKGRNFFGEI